VPIGGLEDAICAVRAGVAMQRELFAFNLLRRTLGQRPLYMGSGLNSGEAVVGNMGSPNTMQFTAMGSTVNQASRIESKTTPGQVLLSESTAASVRDIASLRELPPVELKGIQGKVRIFSVVGLVSDVVPDGLEGLGEPTAVVTYLPCRQVRTGRTFVARGFDVPGGEFGLVFPAVEAEGLKDGDLVQILAGGLRPPTVAPAGITGLQTTPMVAPLAFRIGALTGSPPERTPPFVLATLLTTTDTH
jgi:hypothetical protein